MAKRKSKYADLEKKVEEYFELCDSENCGTKIKKPYTMSGLLYHTGLTRQEFQMLVSKRQYMPMLRSAKQRIEAFIEENSLTGDLSCNASQGSLKYNFGWGEKLDLKEEQTISTVSVVLSDEAKELSK